MTQVAIQETPGGDQPLAKAQGDVVGLTTQLAEMTAYAAVADERVARVQAECDERMADVNTNVEQVQAEVSDLQSALDEAKAAVPAAEKAQEQYDALPQEEKDRLQREKDLARLRYEAEATAAALAAAEEQEAEMQRMLAQGSEVFGLDTPEEG